MTWQPLRTVRLDADSGGIRAAVEALTEGQCVVFPTDTVYGVGADPWNARAVAQLYWAKRRPEHLPIPVLVSAPEHVRQVAGEIPDVFWPLVERHWPGGLTVIVPKNPSLPGIVTARGDSVAVRMPNLPVALRLVEAMGGALAATSANLSGQPSVNTAHEAYEALAGRVSIVLDGGRCPHGIASTIVNLVPDPPVLLRPGPLSLETLREVLPGLVAAKTE